MDVLITACILLAAGGGIYAGYRRYRSGSGAPAPGPAQGLQYPEHGPVGLLLMCLMALVSMIPVVTGTNFLVREGATAAFFEGVGWAVLATGAGLVITYQFYRFHCWTWFFVAGWIAIGMLPALFLLDGNHHDAAEHGPALMLAAACFVALQYLWKRRSDFWFEGDAVRRAIDYEQNGDRWERRSWKDDARELKKRMAEREIAAARPPVRATDADANARSAADEALRGAGRAG